MPFTPPELVSLSAELTAPGWLDRKHVEQLIRIFVAQHGGTISSPGTWDATFHNAVEALRAAVDIHQQLDQQNLTSNEPQPTLIRIALHSTGDVSAPELLAACHGGEIYLSEAVFALLRDAGKFSIYPVQLKSGMAYKALWNHQEVELSQHQPNSHAAAPAKISKFTLIAAITVPLLLVLAITLRQPLREVLGFVHEDRTIEHTITQQH